MKKNIKIDFKKDSVYKITAPVLTMEEIKVLDCEIENDLDNIVNQITEAVLKDRDLIFFQKVIEKQQKEIEKLKDEYKREVFEHQEFVEDTKVAVQDYIKKDKIKEKIEEITSYAYTSAEERDCQDYAIQILKELLGE